MIHPYTGSGLPSAPQLFQQDQRDDEFAKVTSAMRRRWRTFLAIFAGFFLLSLVYALLWPKSYTTAVEVITGNSSQSNNGANTDLPVLNALMAAAGVQSVETYATMIQDKSAAATVIQRLHLPIDVYDLLKYDIYVAPVTNTQIVTLSATWKDPQISANIANEFASVLVERQRALIASQSQQAMDYLSGQLPAAEAAMNKADNALSAFEQKHTVADMTAQTSAAVTQYTDSATRIAQLQLDQSLASATLSNVQGQMSSMSHSSNGGTNVAENPVTTQLKQQLAQVQVELADARRQYTEAHPTVIALEQQEAELQKEIGRVPATYTASETVVPNPIYQQLSAQAANLQSQIAGDQSEMNALNQQQKQFSQRVRSLPTESQTLANLQRDAQLAEGVFTTMKQRYNDALVAKTLSLSDVSVVQPADKRFASITPSLPITLALGFVLGLMLAVSGVFVIDFFDQSIKDETEVYRALGLPVLASVPELSNMSKRDLVNLPTLRALTIEAFLQLVTSLRYSSEKPLHTLTVTSPLQGDGKSTVALNTAIAMAELRPRVLLVDADLRFPTLHEKLGIEQSPGLTEVLVGENTVDQVIRSSTYAGLDVMTAGIASPNPIKLLQGAAFEELIADLGKTYQMVVFDTPALLPMVDSTVVAAKTDATVLVVAANHTDLRSSKRALARLGMVDGVNVLGVLLNRATPNPKERAYFLQSGDTVALSDRGA